MKKKQVFAIMMSAMVMSTSMPVHGVFAKESVMQETVKGRSSAPSESLEDSNGITVAESAKLIDDYGSGKMLEVTAGWNNANKGHAEIKNAEALFKKASFTLLMDIKVSDYDDANKEKIAAFTIGTEEQNIRLFPQTGKLGYGACPGGVSANSVQMSKSAEVGTWCSVAIAYTEDESNGYVTIYMDGEKVLNAQNIGFKLSEANGLTGKIARSYNTNFLLNGLYDHIVVSDTAMTEEAAKTETAKRLSDKKLYQIYKEVSIPNQNDIRGNITLKDKTTDGTKVEWTSDDESVISTKPVENEGYDDVPAGVVTRPSNEDKTVTLTATFKDSENKEIGKKEYKVTVKKAAKKLTESDMKGYFFTYFAGEKYSDGEQIYFASSKDGLNWKDLNENNPILTSNLGEKGVRDPYILRSHEGDKFYMIATDLKINGGNGWTAAQEAGSKSLMVWESKDLVNWSEERMVKVNSDKAGCTWAPEATYDEKTGEYIVYFASKTSDDNYGKQKLYYVKTRDFYNFTEPKVFIEKDQSSIDTTISYNAADGYYYRYTKNEGGVDNELGAKTKTIFIERSKTLLGNDWEQIKSDSLNDNQWVEGPTMFKFIGQNKWCLLLDNFGGGGYYPVVTDDLSTGAFTKPSDSYKMPSRARHGTPIQVTEEEYNAVMAKWGTDAVENIEEEQQAPIAEYNFEDGGKDATGNQVDVVLKGAAAIVKDEETSSKVLKLDGTSETFGELPQGLFDGRNKMTISMDVKAESDSGNYFTFALGKSDQKYMFLKLAGKSVKNVITQNTWSAENGVQTNLESTTKDRWVNIKVALDGKKMQVFADDVLIGINEDIQMDVTELGKNLSAYLGKSFYSGDAYFKGSFDNIKIYNRAITEEDIARIHDLSAMKDAATLIDKLDSSKYTQESFNALKEAAKKVQALEYPSKEEQEVAVNAFYQAFSELQGKSDTSYTDALKVVISGAEKIQQTGYTKASYAKLQDVLKAAREAVKNPTMEKKDAVAHMDAIEAATNGLVTVQIPVLSKANSSDHKTASVKISWSKASGADGYVLYRYNSKKKTYDKIATLGSGTTSYTNSKLKAGTAYTYQVCAVKKYGTEIYEGNRVTLKTATAPSKVTKVKVKKASKSKVKVSWKKVSGASGYVVYMKTGSGKYKKVKTITKGSAASYTKTKLKKGKKYTFKIRAYKKADKTIYGNYSSGKLLKLK